MLGRLHCQLKGKKEGVVVIGMSTHMLVPVLVSSLLGDAIPVPCEN